MTCRDAVTMGVVGAIGFTVALFVKTAAFAEPGPMQDSEKMGALGSVVAANIAIILGRLLRVSAGAPETQTACTGDD